MLVEGDEVPGIDEPDKELPDNRIETSTDDVFEITVRQMLLDSPEPFRRIPLFQPSEAYG